MHQQADARTTRGGNVPSAALDTFARGLAGEVLSAGDDGFAAATLIWNAMVEKVPAFVVRPSGKGDVVRTVHFVKEHGLELSIKGGGHNIAGLALCDGGVTLDMSSITDVIVDAGQRLARVGPGCKLGDVDRATQAHGLATTLGFVSETGVAGLTLGGGIGYLTRRFGWTVDDLHEVEIVTADGAVRRASRNENADLFWALRGGGGNFGVVTEFVFNLHEVGPEITGGFIAWPASDAEAVLRLFRSVTESAPRELTLAAIMRNAPPAPFLPEQVHGKPMIGFVVCHSGSLAQAEADLAAIRGHGKPWADIIQVREYAEQQSLFDASHPKGLSYYWKSEYIPALSDDFIRTYVRQFEHNTSPANQIALFHVAGALNEHAEDDGAVGNRDAAYICIAQGLWPADSDVGESYQRWVRTAWSELKPFATGGNYVNFHNPDETHERIEASYRGNYQRLTQIKAKYDPDNLFRVNRNIPPDGSTVASGSER